MPSPPVPRLKKMVELTLDENPSWRNIEVRNSDIALMVIIWQRWFNVGTNDDSVVHLYRLLDLPREDNIKRVRAHFQNTEHKYMPTNPDILIKRGIEAEYWREALGYDLTPEEHTRHHQNVKDTTPPHQPDAYIISPKVAKTPEGKEAIKQFDKLAEQQPLFDLPPVKPRPNYGL